MEAFQLAVDAGADAIELDVHLTADGQLAVIHDETLDRTTDRTGAVAGLTMDQVREADAGAGFQVDGERPFRGGGTTVPTLGEVLAWLPADLGLVVEIKARAAADAVVGALHDHPARAEGRVSVISFDEATIERVHELDPALRTGYLLVPGQPVEAALEWATRRGHVGVHPWEHDLGDDPSRLIGLAAAYGREMGCYVVNDPQRMLRLALSGLWGFVTDVPAVARETLPRVQR